jgi:PBSX family phage terminase large subunit
MPDFRKTPKQIEATRLMSEKEFVLLEGGSRSGKTFIIIRNIIARALKYNNTKHLTGRLHFNHAKTSLWYKTIPDVMDICFPKIKYTENKSDWFISFDNGSEVWLGGFDDKERVEKILGNEYATIHINEASQISYETFETLKTRLNPPKGVRPLMLIDYNPPSKKHWGYKVFHLQQNPENETALASKHKYGVLRMNPADNLDNLNESYIETLEGLGDRRKRRFFYGEYSDDTEGALWKREWIHENRVDSHPDLARIVVSVDPAVTNTDTSDDTGIIVVGTDGKEFFVLADYTYNGDVTGWGMSVVDAYKRHKADKVVAEQNQGGDLVKINIRNYDKMIPIEMVHATRGKAIRAEPVADLYNRGLVHHVCHLIELEDELCEWTPEEKTSPNRLDALVWGITFLSGGKIAEVNLSSESIKALWGTK